MLGPVLPTTRRSRKVTPVVEPVKPRPVHHHDANMSAEERLAALWEPTKGLTYTCDACGGPMLDEDAVFARKSEFDQSAPDVDWFVCTPCQPS